MDKHGALKYVEGSDRTGEDVYISDQPHVKTLLETQENVVSRSFKAVEGYFVIAIYVPVFKRSRTWHGCCLTHSTRSQRIDMH